MSAVLELDHLENAMIDVTPDGVRIVRMGRIRGIDTTLPPQEIFAAGTAVAGMPAYNSFYPQANYANAMLRRRTFLPVRGRNTVLDVELTYETLGLATLPPSTFILEKHTRIVQETTQIDESTDQEIRMSYFDPDIDSFRPSDTVTFPVMSPWTELIAYGYFTSGSPPDHTPYIRNVNSTTWRNLPVGYWLYVGQSDKTQDRGLSYDVNLSLISRVRRDWSEYQFFYDRTVGRTLPPDKVGLKALRAAPYKYGIIRYRSGVGDVQANGVTRYGAYPTADFNAIFGFGGIGT